MLILRLIYLKFCNPICNALRELVPFVQFLKRKKGFETFTSWPNNSNNANGLCHGAQKMKYSIRFGSGSIAPVALK